MLLSSVAYSVWSLKQVYTKTADKEKGEKGYLWTSDGWDTKCKGWNFQCLIKMCSLGSGSFTITEVDDVPRGTKIELGTRLHCVICSMLSPFYGNEVDTERWCHRVLQAGRMLIRVSFASHASVLCLSCTLEGNCQKSSSEASSWAFFMMKHVARGAWSNDMLWGSHLSLTFRFTSQRTFAVLFLLATRKGCKSVHFAHNSHGALRRESPNPSTSRRCLSKLWTH